MPRRIGATLFQAFVDGSFAARSIFSTRARDARTGMPSGHAPRAVEGLSPRRSVLSAGHATTPRNRHAVGDADRKKKECHLRQAEVDGGRAVRADGAVGVRQHLADQRGRLLAF